MEKSISFHVDKTFSLAHNNRTQKRHSNKDIDSEFSDQNISYIRIPLKKFYDLEFGEAVAEYNSKQKRKDRRIENYYSKIKNNKRTALAREAIVQIGTQEVKRGSQEWNTEVKILDVYAKVFEQRNPNLKVANMVMHLDESTPHLHITFVPVSHSKRGLRKRVGFEKAILEQDPQAPKRFMEYWSNKERDEIERLAKEFDPTFKREVVGTHTYMKVPEYKKVQEELKSTEKEIKKEYGKQIAALAPDEKIPFSEFYELRNNYPEGSTAFIVKYGSSNEPFKTEMGFKQLTELFSLERLRSYAKQLIKKMRDKFKKIISESENQYRTLKKEKDNLVHQQQELVSQKSQLQNENIRLKEMNQMTKTNLKKVFIELGLSESLANGLLKNGYLTLSNTGRHVGINQVLQRQIKKASQEQLNRISSPAFYQRPGFNRNRGPRL